MLLFDANCDVILTKGDRRLRHRLRTTGQSEWVITTEETVRCTEDAIARLAAIEYDVAAAIQDGWTVVFADGLSTPRRKARRGRSAQDDENTLNG